MKDKKIRIIISITVIIAMLFGYIANFVSYAVDTTLTNVSLSATDKSVVGYSIGNPGTGGGFATNKIWNFKINGTITDRTLYCVKGGFGETWGSNENNTKTYNLSYDLQADRAKLAKLLAANNTTANGVIEKLIDPNRNAYRELLWLLDNFYIKGENKTAYLEKMLGATYSYDSEYENPHCFDFPDGQMLEVTDLLTDEDIIAIQRAVIWYFTNYKLDGESKYNKKNNETNVNSIANSWMTITTNGSAYSNLQDLSNDRSKQSQLLYNALINKAEANKGLYTAENNYNLNAPAKVTTTSTKANKIGDKTIIGPITITAGTYTNIAVNVTRNGQAVGNNYTITDANGNSLGKTIEQIATDGGTLYISVDNSTETDEVSAKISITSQTTRKILWLEGTETSNSITLTAEQPLVEITKTPQTDEVTLTGKLEKEKIFDLSLRKYITHVNGTSVPNTRVPNISEDTLQTGTTATYKHKKDPVVIKENDIVTYSITIYNEGEKAGYANQIIDQLPSGLIMLSSGDGTDKNPSTIVATDKNGNSKNSYTWKYDTSNNKVTFDIVKDGAKSLSPYSNKTNGVDLDYETITFKCKVVAEPDTKEQKILTNVAWISGAFDTETGKAAIDRDSQPETTPKAPNGNTLNKDNMEDYKGNPNNKNDLTDKNYHYEGYQDDDDFEKLVLMPEEKIFDLALKKFIAAVSKDQTIEAGEYLTDTKNEDGIYDRAPIVTAIYNREQVDGVNIKDTVEYREHSKEPLMVEHGDYVLYTIRVYNQGEVNGYASKIKDTLPLGLKFVTDNEEINGIWKLEGLDSEGRQIISTTWFAKGNGAELNSVEGDENYKANLLTALKPDDAISEQNPDYIDAQVLCYVEEQSTSNRVLVNYAQISDDTDEKGNPVEDIDSTPDEWKGEDDEDIEKIKLQCFDLSLRKFITAINGVEQKESNGKYTREPVVDVTPLINGTDSTAIYTHSKKPLSVQIGDKIVYTLRAYNEGDINGYASEITDYLPPYLTFDKDSEINKQYGWEVSEDGRKVTTKYLADKELEAFDGETTLDYEDVKIECIISDKAPVKENITNIAEISEYTYNGHTVPDDADSTADNIDKDLPEDKDLPSYKDDEINKPYVPGNEDDDDFEKVYIKDFDLALRKFITKIQENDVTSRIPQPSIGEDGNIKYAHPKDALTVHVDDTVIYTIRVYNEGEINGYASEITDDIPEYLEYLPEHATNTEYMWKMYDENGNETQDVSKAVKVKTEYLSKDNEKNDKDNLLLAFDGNIENLSYKDIKIAFKVKDPKSNTLIITNHAQISEDTDENGKDIDDKDSTPDEWNEKDDDQDIENIKVEYFDLSLLKFVSKVIVIEDGKEKITETGYNGHEEPEPVVKVELHRKKLSNVTVKFGYGITITNEGDIEGYAKEITDYVPEGLKFVAADNPNWKDEGNNVISTRQLENTLLKPGESATVEVILTWINGNDNLNLKTNTAEISEDDNPYDVPDKDSTPDNKKEGEDDIDIAKVILTVATGAPRTYFLLTLGLLTVVVIGVASIKKFVL